MACKEGPMSLPAAEIIEVLEHPQRWNPTAVYIYIYVCVSGEHHFPPAKIFIALA